MRAIFLIGLALAIAGCKKKERDVAKREAASVGGTARTTGPANGREGSERGSEAKNVDANDLKLIHTFIEYASGASGRMPSTETTLAAIRQESPETARKISEGLIVLNPARSREEIWAYEAKALESSGWVATNNGVETMDAATLKRRLGK